MDKEKIALTDRSKILPATLAMGASGDELTAIGWTLAGIQDYVKKGLKSEDIQQKQLCLWQIVRLLHFDVSGEEPVQKSKQEKIAHLQSLFSEARTLLEGFKDERNGRVLHSARPEDHVDLFLHYALRSLKDAQECIDCALESEQAE